MVMSGFQWTYPCWLNAQRTGDTSEICWQRKNSLTDGSNRMPRVYILMFSQLERVFETYRISLTMMDFTSSSWQRTTHRATALLQQFLRWVMLTLGLFKSGTTSDRRFKLPYHALFLPVLRRGDETISCIVWPGTPGPSRDWSPVCPPVATDVCPCGFNSCTLVGSLRQSRPLIWVLPQTGIARGYRVRVLVRVYVFAFGMKALAQQPHAYTNTTMDCWRKWDKPLRVIVSTIKSIRRSDPLVNRQLRTLYEAVGGAECTLGPLLAISLSRFDVHFFNHAVNLLHFPLNTSPPLAWPRQPTRMGRIIWNAQHIF